MAGAVTVSGWAADPAAPSGTGVDAVDVYLDGPFGSGTFLAGATYGDARPDVAAALGSDRFRSSGWHFTWNTSALRRGDHSLYVYGHSTATGAWTLVTRSVVVGFAEDPLVAIDSPAAAQRVSGQVRIEGWAADRNAASGAGVDAIHIYLGPYPQGTFLGAATYGSSRPDVAAALGSLQFTSSGWSLLWDARGVRPGDYQLVVYAHSTSVDDWNERSVAITVEALPDPLVSIDVPAAGSRVSGTVEVAGWAIDRHAREGTGVDAVHVYLDGAFGLGGRFLGAAAYGVSRPDVGAAFGSNRFNNSGWSFAWNTAGLSPGPHTLYVYARSTASGEWKLVTQQVTTG